MSFINRIITGALLTGSSLGFSGCESPYKDLITRRQEEVKELLADRPAKEYKQAVGGWRRNLAIADAQSTIDSIVYKQVFDGTVAAQDSQKVKEFNSIAGKMKIKNSEITTYDKPYEELDKKMLDMNITTKDFYANTKEYSRYNNNNSPMFEEKVLAVRQFKADSMAYNNFFKENNLLTPEVTQKLEKVAKKVKLKP